VRGAIGIRAVLDVRATEEEENGDGGSVDGG
jgi:hypothetical protein